MGSPGEVALQSNESKVFLLYDYMHIFKDIKWDYIQIIVLLSTVIGLNTWITESSKQLAFAKGKKYQACWNDVIKLYNVDKQNAVQSTKLSYSFYTKPLQC